MLIVGKACSQPYNASLYNISAMSFGALSANAILALNIGAKDGGFAHDTGEGSISKYHPEGGGIPMDKDCVSPASHSAFSTPLELMEFIGTLRKHSGGKPVGFKLCIGHRREFMCMVKAMIATKIVPDFIVIDGTEGGTGAAPLEFANHVGMPMIEGLSFVHNTLRGAGLRDQVKLGAAGKIVSAFDIARALAIGADWCNSARGYVFAIGCIQPQACHTNHCPVGVATQDPLRQRALDPVDKSKRVARLHKNTLAALGEMTGAAGLSSLGEFLPRHLMIRPADAQMVTGDEAFFNLEIGALLKKKRKSDPEGYHARWDRARADQFAPID